MERLDEDLVKSRWLKKEHEDRYQFIKPLVRGRVIDCACGIGYASQILESQNISSYLGIDVSKNSIRIASKKYATSKTKFSVNSLLDLPILDNSVDTFISMETLEHLKDPLAALREIRRTLNPDGVFLGSVPSKAYEKLCTQAYGPNPFHIQTFSLNKLRSLLEEYFENVYIFSITFNLGSMVQLIQEKTAPINQLTRTPDLPPANRTPLGSFLFVAGSAELDKSTKLNEFLRTNHFYYCHTKAELDMEVELPLRNSILKMDEMIKDRDSAITSQSRMLEERWSIMESMEKTANGKENLIKTQEEELSKRGASLKLIQNEITKRDEVITNQKSIIESITRENTKNIELIKAHNTQFNRPFIRILSRLGLIKRLSGL
jgi:ubiquinone/menaquinone biosynthesis C-methylase UbiE